MRAVWLVMVAASGCGGKIAPLDYGSQTLDDGGAGASAGDVVTPPAQPQVGPLGPLPPPILSAPAECTHLEASKSIIATTCVDKISCFEGEAEQRVVHCPCGDYRMRLDRTGCVEAVESWAQNVSCVAEALLGERFCSVKGDGTSSETCVSLSIPCVR